MKAHTNLIVTMLISTSFCLPLRLLASDNQNPLYLKRKERLEAEERVKDATKTLANPNATTAERLEIMKTTYIDAHKVRVTKETLATQAPEKEQKWRQEQLRDALLQSAFLKGGLVCAGYNPEEIVQKHIGAGQTISAPEAAEVIQQAFNKETQDVPAVLALPAVITIQTSATTSTISIPSTTTTTITTTTTTTTTATTATKEQQTAAKKTDSDKQNCIIL